MGWRELERMKTVFIEHLRTSLYPLTFRVHDDKDSKFLAVVGFFMRYAQSSSLSIMLIFIKNA